LTLLVLVIAGLPLLRADLKVASLATVTTDLAHQIGGTNVTVEAIIRPGTDPHEFEPTTGDVGKVANADLVLLTGKRMEGYLSNLEEAAGRPSFQGALPSSMPRPYSKKEMPFQTS
jgi:ABC-type Zn uptake system ZnuABC Zn-binding protein ZnuA